MASVLQAEAVKIAEAAKVDDATAALLEQTRLAAAREKARADDLESRISTLRQEVVVGQPSVAARWHRTHGSRFSLLQFLASLPPTPFTGLVSRVTPGPIGSRSGN